MSLKTQNLDLRRRLDECEEPREADISDHVHGAHAASRVVQDLSGDSRDGFHESWVNESGVQDLSGDSRDGFHESWVQEPWGQESWVQDPSDLSGFSRADAESGWQEALGHHESLESLHLPPWLLHP